MTTTPPLHLMAVAGVCLALVGCAGGPVSTHPGAQGATVRADAPLVAVPRVSGSSAGRSPQAQASTSIGSHRTPARLLINARASGHGIRLSPVLQSRYVHWRF